MSGPVQTASTYRDRNSTADRALEILTMFSDVEPVLAGAVVANRLGVARSTAYRYLQSLESSHFLEEAPHGGFRLGLRVLELARVARLGYGLSELALAPMTDLANRAQETILLTRRIGDLVVCVDRVEAGTGAVRISYERGSTFPINAGASALVLLAWSPAEEARAIFQSTQLRRFTPATLTDVDSLMARLNQIRERGYSVTRAELDADVVGIAAPIRDENGLVTAAISVVALASRIPMAREDEIVSHVLAAARRITEGLTVRAG